MLKTLMIMAALCSSTVISAAEPTDGSRSNLVPGARPEPAAKPTDPAIFDNAEKTPGAASYAEHPNCAPTAQSPEVQRAPKGSSKDNSDGQSSGC